MTLGILASLVLTLSAAVALFLRTGKLLERRVRVRLGTKSSDLVVLGDAQEAFALSTSAIEAGLSVLHFTTKASAQHRWEIPYTDHVSVSKDHAVLDAASRASHVVVSDTDDVLSLRHATDLNASSMTCMLSNPSLAYELRHDSFSSALPSLELLSGHEVVGQYVSEVVSRAADSQSKGEVVVQLRHCGSSPDHSDQVADWLTRLADVHEHIDGAPSIKSGKGAENVDVVVLTGPPEDVAAEALAAAHGGVSTDSVVWIALTRRELLTRPGARPLGVPARKVLEADDTTALDKGILIIADAEAVSGDHSQVIEGSTMRWARAFHAFYGAANGSPAAWDEQARKRSADMVATTLSGLSEYGFHLTRDTTTDHDLPDVAAATDIAGDPRIPREVLPAVAAFFGYRVKAK